MDIFDVLTAIVKRKLELMLSGINEHEALMNAEIDVSEEDFEEPLFLILPL